MVGTAEIAEFVVEFPENEIPSEELEAVERSWFDVVGVLLAGSVQPLGQMIVDYVRRRGGRGHASVVATSVQAPPTEAALANGTMAHALDYDDMGAYGHPTVTIFPALLGLAEYRGGTSGAALAVAHAIGFEMGASLFGAGYDQYDRAFDGTPIFGVLTATAAGCRLMGLSVDETRSALGIAASEACGIGRNDGTMTKPLHAGLAARNAVQAVLLARRGFSAAVDVLERTQGFCETFFGKGVVKTEEVVGSLGRPFKASRSVMIKKYPCCGDSHSALDGLLDLVRQEHLRYENIREVEVQAMSPTSPGLRYQVPRSGLNGKFSIHHALAVAIRKGAVVIDDFTDDAVRSSELVEARDKVRAEVMARWDRRLMYRLEDGNTVKVVLADGRVLTNRVGWSALRGSVTVPLTEDELVGKFRENASLALGSEQVDEAVGRWRHLTRVDDIRKSVESVVMGEGRPLG